MKWFHRRRGSDQYIKRAIDNLPSGVCFFDAEGILVLSNHQMNLLATQYAGRDLQRLADLQDMVNAPVGGAVRLPGEPPLLSAEGRVWQFTLKEITLAGGEKCTQAMAADVTELYRVQQELEADTEQQRQIAAQLTQMQKNVVTLASGEETLRLKMKIHDDIGRSVVMTKRLLQTGQPAGEVNLSLWWDAVTVLQRDTMHLQAETSLEKFQRDAEALGVEAVLHGELPTDERARRVVLAAMHECLTNAVRHAGGSELSVSLQETTAQLSIRITNNGEAPRSEIVEGGGLSALRRRVENEQGTMCIRSSPHFELRMTLPTKGKTL